MSYDLSNLSPADFEDLVRDLIDCEMGVRFEAFGAGPDGGADGRHAVGGKSIVLQAKHYVRSTFSSLVATMKRERASIGGLAPQRYILATSRPLSPANKHTLASVIGPALKDEADIISAGDLNGLLRKYPDIAKAHIKLWLSDTAVLERVIRSAAYSYTAMSRAEVQLKVARNNEPGAANPRRFRFISVVPPLASASSSGLFLVGILDEARGRTLLPQAHC